jgi:hypothetical protein
MKRSFSLLACLLLLIPLQFACRRGLNNKLPGSKLNPYEGAVKDLLPQQVGDFMLVETSSLNELEQELRNPRDGVGAIYNSSKNHTVQHLLVAFKTAAEANQELDAALRRYQKAQVNVRVEDVKDAANQTVGRRLIVNDRSTEAFNWTNGSLYCTAVSYTGYSSEFVKDLPY